MRAPPRPADRPCGGPPGPRPGEQTSGPAPGRRAGGGAAGCRHALGGLGLEVVGPGDVEMVLPQLAPLLLDGDGAGPERGVLVGRVLLDDPVAGFRLDAGLARVVDATGQVTVGAGSR